VMALLIEKGVDVHATTKFGWTALMIGAWYKASLEVMALLIEKRV